MGNDIKTDSAWANSLFGELVVRSMLALGVEHFFVSPGSRSSPLIVALEQLDDGDYTVVLDERSASFQALGRIKATAKPAALICTSGTAGSHYYPAVIEARESGLPLIVLTADRPPELRNCHAGQTIDQLKLFGYYPVFDAELPIPEINTVLFQQVRETCRVAVESAMKSPGGPVHLNCPFREPFLPANGKRPKFDNNLTDGLLPVSPVESWTEVITSLPERTLILAGPRSGTDPENELVSLASLARKYGWPILADAANPMRYRSDLDMPVIVHYDRVSRDDQIWNDLKPDAVILWGEPPTSKVLRQRLSELDLPGYLINGGKHSINPIHGKIVWAGSTVARFVENCSGQSGDFAEDWREADDRMEAHLRQRLKLPHTLFEGDIHHALGTMLPQGVPVVLANSLTIRDAEWFIPFNRRKLLPFSQRGANGIDGTVSMARGIAESLSSPVWLVTGDLAFLHDSNGLLGLAGAENGLFVVLMNNQGGGIFELLPVAEQCGKFEQLFATPQTVDLEKLVGAHGGGYRPCESVESLEEAIQAWNGKGFFVAEVKIDRKTSKELRKQHLIMKDD